jgi:hypothetical protein
MRDNGKLIKLIDKIITMRKYYYYVLKYVRITFPKKKPVFFLAYQSQEKVPEA